MANKGRVSWDMLEQRYIDTFVLEAKKIHENSPENDESLKRMIEAFAIVYGGKNKHESERPFKDVVMERVFES